MSRPLPSCVPFRTERFPVSSYPLNGLGSIALSRYDLPRAGALLTEALALACESSSADCRLRASFLLVRYYHLTGETQKASSLLDDLEAFARPKTLPDCGTLAEGVRAWYDVMQGNIGAGRIWASDWSRKKGTRNDEELLPFLFRQPGPPTSPMGDILVITLARLRLLEGRPEIARSLLCTLRHLLHGQGRRGNVLEAETIAGHCRGIAWQLRRGKVFGLGCPAFCRTRRHYVAVPARRKCPRAAFAKIRHRMSIYWSRAKLLL